MTRFVVLEHRVNDSVHYDLLLEVEGQERLRALQLERWPLAAGEATPCRELEPHRRVYLDYEGEISGGRGVVRRVEAGTWANADGAIKLAGAGETVLLELEPNASRLKRRA